MTFSKRDGRMVYAGALLAFIITISVFAVWPKAAEPRNVGADAYIDSFPSTPYLPSIPAIPQTCGGYKDWRGEEHWCAPVAPLPLVTQSIDI